MTYTLPKEQCPYCGRMVATYVPAGGDGSASLFRSHTGQTPKVRCVGTRREAPNSMRYDGPRWNVQNRA